MNILKKGPEIKLPRKMPELKVPGFLEEVYLELRERHLLPLVAVLIAAIVAVPVALSEAGRSAAEIEASVPSPTPGKTPVVVAKSVTGLRDYRRRLKGLRAKDPFRQQFTSAEESGTLPAEGREASSGGETGSEPGGTGGSTTTGGGANGPVVHHEVKYYSWAIDVRVVPVSANGKPSKAKPTVRKNQPELTMLPGRKTPAVIFIGPSADEKKALMLVSSNVTAMFGDAVCVLGGETCEMVALEKGVPETFVYGGNERVFRIELEEIHLVATDKLNRASLGKPGGGNGAG
jgi:hypothetical protein